MHYTCIIAFTGGLVGSSNPLQQSSPPIQSPIQSTIQSSDQRRPPTNALRDLSQSWRKCNWKVHAISLKSISYASTIDLSVQQQQKCKVYNVANPCSVTMVTAIPLSSHHAQDALCGSFSFGHMKCQLKLIRVSVTSLLMRGYHCHGNRKIEFFCYGVFVSVSHYSLKCNQLSVFKGCVRHELTTKLLVQALIKVLPCIYYCLQGKGAHKQ